MAARFRVVDTGVRGGRANIAFDAALIEAHKAGEIPDTMRGFSDHPELGPLRPGRKDEAAIRFNHKLHLSTTKIGESDKLGCVSCHMIGKDGG